MGYHIHICRTCQSGPFCDCGAFNGDDTTYYPRQLRLFADDNLAVTRLNETIKQLEVQTWKEDTTSWKEWIATGRTLWRATLQKTRSRLSWRSLIGR